MLKYDISAIRSSHDYSDAALHLQRTLPIDTLQPEELETKANEWNRVVEDYQYNYLHPRIKNKLSEYGNVVDDAKHPNEIIFGEVIDLLQNYWFLRILNPHFEDGKDIDEILSVIESKLNEDVTYEYQRNYTLLRICGRTAAYVTEENAPKLKNTLKELVKDRCVIDKLINFSHRKSELLKKSEDLKLAIDSNLIYPIEADKYYTICECCAEGRLIPSS